MLIPKGMHRDKLIPMPMRQNFWNIRLIQNARLMMKPVPPKEAVSPVNPRKNQR